MKIRTISDLFVELGVGGLFPLISSSLTFLTEQEKKDVDTLLRYNYSSFIMFDMFKSNEQLLEYLTTFCRSMSYKWEKLKDTTELDYNPIWNVDGTETRTRLASDNYTQESGTTKNNNGKNTTTSNSAVINKTTLKNDGNIVNEQNTDAVMTHGKKVAENYKEVYERGGNIGVTSTQNLMQQERDIVDFNLIEVITKDIAMAICMP